MKQVIADRPYHMAQILDFLYETANEADAENGLW
jgi:hypothetical protein